MLDKRYITFFASALIGGVSEASAMPYMPDVILAKPYYDEINLNQYWMSEKLDGIRAIWTGDKLVTRTGRQIYAPGWFLDALPDFPVEGELWAGRSNFNHVQKTVLDKEPEDTGWKKIKFMLFDLYGEDLLYEERYSKLIKQIDGKSSPILEVVQHQPIVDRVSLYDFMRQILSQGGEGVMLRRVGSLYVSGRTDDLLKLKQVSDTEAKVIGYKEGRGKYTGLMGALLVELECGSRMYIGTGFTDKERAAPPVIGSVITIQYSGYTSGGLPRFARFLRERMEE
ncbi:DNA ligase [Vibrio sp. HN007]|uniref:DNA ligase n=1 Tax=Vibrio iocasae TaxID=3098914 RepID=UPI0035D3DD55